MKKESLALTILMGLLLSQLPIAYADECAPAGTVYRDGCPIEVLVSSLCRDCDPCAPVNHDHCAITKKETKDIIWASSLDEVVVGAAFDGDYGCVYYCSSFDKAVNQCWPKFNTPL